MCQGVLEAIRRQVGDLAETMWAARSARELGPDVEVGVGGIWHYGQLRHVDPVRRLKAGRRVQAGEKDRADPTPCFYFNPDSAHLTLTHATQTRV